MTYTKTFLTIKAAQTFARNLMDQGWTVELWTDRGGFKQTVYIVKWHA